MTGERRYDDDEVRHIFDDAAGPAGPDGPATSHKAASGLTLAELQDIGSEVGLSPERIARAAASLDLPREVLPRKTQLGMPVSVGRVVELPRAPTDHEWDLLVSRLRETFGARGKVSRNGGIREWTNGNLHAYVEPTENGHRLRLGTLNGGGLAMNFGGVVAGSLAVAMAVPLALSGRLAEDGPAALAVFAVAAVAAFVANAVRLPRWASEREAQMEDIAHFAVELSSGDPAPPSDDEPQP